MELLNQIKVYTEKIIDSKFGEKITDSRVLEKISISLSKKYESFIALIEELIGSLKSDRVKIVMIL